ncbi:hypothetical protein CGSMWGv55152_03197 [Gardnerella vaginalis 55152]|uniref:Uncharacterized protein n=1 Tax=Gardnerella vaginalis 55152 TaxID=698955 RepID=I4LT09_GARVA|nr:hypothetical protein CGSMWGv55152_03197 [Gardnerella vaginalis 55152]
MVIDYGCRSIGYKYCDEKYLGVLLFNAYASAVMADREENWRGYIFKGQRAGKFRVFIYNESDFISSHCNMGV